MNTVISSTVGVVGLGLLLLTSPLHAADLSTYRQFHLDSNLSRIAEEARVDPREASVIHRRPALIQELSWRSGTGDSVSQIVFGFYNGNLFRMVVSYDRDQIEGLTTGDMIDAISKQYGAAAIDPAAEIPLSTIYDDKEVVKVLARWDDPRWSLNLVRSKYGATFFVVALSKRLSPAAGEAAVEARRLDRDEAPQREIDRKRSEREEANLQQEKARTANKADFRP